MKVTQENPMKYRLQTEFKDMPRSLDTEAEIDFGRIKVLELRKAYDEYEIALERLERLKSIAITAGEKSK